jgi:hypothetical protein
MKLEPSFELLLHDYIHNVKHILMIIPEAFMKVGIVGYQYQHFQNMVMIIQEED